jgi:hypothetical protein
MGPSPAVATILDKLVDDIAPNKRCLVHELMGGRASDQAAAGNEACSIGWTKTGTSLRLIFCRDGSSLVATYAHLQHFALTHMY